MKKASVKQSSQFKGVSYHKSANKFRAYLKINGKMKYLGLFYSEHEAAQKYDEAAFNHFGQFAKLNFPNLAAQKEQQND